MYVVTNQGYLGKQLDHSHSTHVSILSLEHGEKQQIWMLKRDLLSIRFNLFQSIKNENQIPLQ